MYNNIKIRFDEYKPWKKSDTSIVIFHGVGGNGRLLSFIAIPLLKAGYNVIYPDLPGYGYTMYSGDLDYAMWVDVGSFMVNKEMEKGKKIYLFGLSAGGMLAYNVACNTKKIAGLIVTNILDNRYQIVRDYSAKNRFQSRIGIKIMGMISVYLQKRIRIAVKEVANMRTIVNDKELMKILMRDKVGSGISFSLYFLLSMIRYIPLVEPEDFSLCPVLLVHPEQDMWTPVDISKLFFDRIKAPRWLQMLKNAGHFPIESPGLQQLEKELLSFIENGIHPTYS
ncbi:MAG: alpha/beta hydrolase [Nanobdellota archaeon]